MLKTLHLSPFQIQTTYSILNTEQLYCYYTPNTEPWGIQYTYYTSYQIQKNSYYCTKIQNIVSPKTNPKYRTLNTGHSNIIGAPCRHRPLQHPKCPYQYNYLHRVVIAVCWFSALSFFSVCGMNGMLSVGCIVFDQDRPVIA